MVPLSLVNSRLKKGSCLLVAVGPSINIVHAQSKCILIIVSSAGKLLSGGDISFAIVKSVLLDSITVDSMVENLGDC